MTRESGTFPFPVFISGGHICFLTPDVEVGFSLLVSGAVLPPWSYGELFILWSVLAFLFRPVLLVLGMVSSLTCGARFAPCVSKLRRSAHRVEA